MNSNETEAAELLARWRRDHAAAGIDRAAAQHRLDALGKMIAGMEALYPSLATKVEATAPAWTSVADALANIDASNYSAETRQKIEKSPDARKATDVVREILKEQPNRWFSTGEMVREFRSRRIEGSQTAIRLALRRTNGRESDMRETDDGQLYRFRSESASSNTLEAL